MKPALRRQAEADARAAIEGVLSALTGPELSAELAVAPFRVYGDALRLGIDVPRQLRLWAERRGPPLLDGVLRAAAEELASPLPPAEARSQGLDPILATRIHARDGAESVLRAVRRVWLPRSLAQLEGYAVIVARCADVDRALSALLSRKDVLLLLGVRAALGGAWAETLPDEAEERGDGTELLEALRSAPPTPEMIARYVERGAFRQVVERAAAESASFAEQLDATIEAMRRIGQVAFVARAWWKRRAPAANAFTFRGPRLAVAAASGDVEPETQVHRLGRMFEHTDIEVALHVSPREITLEMDFDRGAVASVDLGDAHREVRLEEETCRIMVARGTVPVRMRVELRSGEQVTEELRFESTEA